MSRDRLPRYQVQWHGWQTVGATRLHRDYVYYFRASSERAAVVDARDVMANLGIEPVGVPTVRLMPGT